VGLNGYDKVMVVDPTKNTVELDGVTYRITIDENGIVSLSQMFLIPGDVNGDLKVDSQDLTTLFQAGKYETGAPATPEEGDLDGNGLFESADLIILMRNYGREVLYHMAFGDGQLVIEKQPDRNGNIQTFARVFVPTSEEPLVEFEVLLGSFEGRDFLITYDFGVTHADRVEIRTTDGRDVVFDGSVPEGRRASYTVGEFTTSELFGRTKVLAVTLYDLFKIGNAHTFKRDAFAVIGWEMPGLPNIDYIDWEYNESGDLVHTDIRFDHPNIEDFYKSFALISDDLLLVGFPPEDVISEDIVDFQTTQEASGVITSVTATTVDGRVIFVELTRQGFEVEIRRP